MKRLKLRVILSYFLSSHLHELAGDGSTQVGLGSCANSGVFTFSRRILGLHTSLLAEETSLLRLYSLGCADSVQPCVKPGEAADPEAMFLRV